VLVPHAARAHPAVRRAAEDADARLLRAVVGAGDAVGVRGDHDVGLPIVVDVGDHGVLPQGARRVARGRDEVVPRLAVVHPEVVLVGVDDLGLAVAVEVEHGRAGDRDEQSCVVLNQSVDLVVGHARIHEQRAVITM
jgi:hypothetical protein